MDTRLEYSRRFTRRFFSGIASQPLKIRIDVFDYAVAVCDHHGVGRLLDGAGELTDRRFRAQRINAKRQIIRQFCQLACFLCVKGIGGRLVDRQHTKS